MGDLGKALQRSKRERQRQCRKEYRDLVEADRNEALEAEMLTRRTEKNTLKSIWETNDLDDFLAVADAREEGYFAERDVRVVIDGKVHIVQDDRVVPQQQAEDTNKNWLELSELLTIPRRPQWTYDMSAQELQNAENAMFLDWRRSLSMMEEEHKVLMTPYEKNLEVWRQLWRVVERADIVMLIVDARNPLIFRCKAFELYVQETKNRLGGPKKFLLLLNKADLLTENQRRSWAEYFQSKGDTVFFFSARPLEEEEVPAIPENDDGSDTPDGTVPLTPEQEAAALKRLTRDRNDKSRHKKKSLRAPVEVANAYQLAEMRQALRRQALIPRPHVVQPPTAEEIARDERAAQQQPVEPWHLLNPIQLLDQLVLLRSSAGVADANTPLMVGLVGYPNVGKSSTINALVGAKKVIVSATPGKTKHFQTLTIPEERRVALCDCPGLVFPSFASTKEHMVCDGILPVDTVTDALKSAAVICRRLPRELLEMKLNVSLLAEHDVDESISLAERLLNAMARCRGYMASHDRPNRARAGKDLLKLYVDGHFVYAEPPPNYRPDPQLMRMEHYMSERVVLAGAHETDDEEYEDWDSDDEQAWADLDDAADERALSDHGDQDSVDSNEEVAAPMFYARPHGYRHSFTRFEYFNLEGNEKRMAARKVVRRKKKRTNHQLEPDMHTFINRDGEVELRIDDDDGVLELVNAAGAPARAPIKEKQRTKKQQRKDLRKMGDGPANPSARRVVIRDY